MRKEFTFRAEWAEVINALPVQDQEQLYRAVVRCGMEGLVPELDGAAAAVWKMGLGREVRASFSHWKAGCKGGAPKGNNNASKNNQKNNQKTTKNKKVKVHKVKAIDTIKESDKNNQKNNQKTTKITPKCAPETPVTVFAAPDNLNNNLIKKSTRYNQDILFPNNEEYNHTLKERNTGKKESPPAPRRRFEKPTLQQLEEYIAQKGLAVDAAAFLDHYESNGWMVGRTAMRDWKAACRTWDRQNNRYKSKQHDNNERTNSSINETAVRVLGALAERERR